MARYGRRKLRTSAVVAITALISIVVLAAIFTVYFIIRGRAPASSSESSSSSQSLSSSQSSSGSLSSSKSSSSSSSKIAATGYLMLVNKTHECPNDYNPQLTTLPAKYYLSDNDHHLEATAAQHLQEMLDAAKGDGVNIGIVSAYRSKDKQQTLFQDDVNSLIQKGSTQSQAEITTAQTVAPPGYSEHQTGLATDLGYNGKSYLDSSFDKTPAFTWLMAHCANYGFILRYPKDKVDVTKYDYEPWHYRYVGIDNAKAIVQSGKCLEEYLGILS